MIKRNRFALVLSLTATSLLIGMAAVILFSKPKITSFSQVKTQHKGSDIWFKDRDNQLLHQWRKDRSVRSYAWTDLSEISPLLISEVIKSEDRKFYSHHGVDLKALVASMYQRLFKGSSRGGSTISMQLLKLVYGKNSYSGYSGKLIQIISSFQLEQTWSKSEILEAYLNLIPMRGEQTGIPSSSWLMFNKPPSALSQVEATLMAVLIRSPNADSKDWQRRACEQLGSLCEEFKKTIPALVTKTFASVQNQNALHLAQRLSANMKAGEVRTTLQKDLQVFVQEQIQSQIRALEKQNVHDAAVLVLENKTGEVWAYVGGSGLHRESTYVDGVRALRQAGSTLKPFLYATAFEKNLLHANSWIEDSAVDIVFERGVYKPQNHDRKYYGWVQAKTALGSSLNVPAVKVFKILNDESFWQKLSALKFRELKEPDHYGPALALGVADVTLEDLTNGYRTLAQQGQYSAIRFTQDKNPLEETQVFSAPSAAEVVDILSESENRILGFGLDSNLSVHGAAVKTGTSKDMRDNWCVGFNSRFTVGVWVGNFSGEPMWNVMGITGAAPIWQKTIQWLEERYPAQSLNRVTSQGTQMEPLKYPRPKMAYPQDGMILALDPGIPAENQKMPLLVDGEEGKKLYWKINGHRMAALKVKLWQPQRGRHTFELYEGDKLLESATILVK